MKLSPDQHLILSLTTINSNDPPQALGYKNNYIRHIGKIKGDFLIRKQYRKTYATVKPIAIKLIHENQKVSRLLSSPSAPEQIVRTQIIMNPKGTIFDTILTLNGLVYANRILKDISCLNNGCRFSN